MGIGVGDEQLESQRRPSADIDIALLLPRSTSNTLETTSVNANEGSDNAEGSSGMATNWRRPLQHRLRTVGVALILCLHIGVDPPDVIRPSTGATRLESWIDPFSMPPDKARESIARTLQQQYEYWQPKAKFKIALDPTADDVRRVLGALRKGGGKAERIVVHYNGHGVPKPTRNGELWLFNKQFTQYIPFNVRDLHSAVDGPALYVFDCSSAGHLHSALAKINPDQFILSACGAGEMLPVVGGDDVPADIFSSCLTTPMEVALRVFPKEDSYFLPSGSERRALELPGRLNDRSSILGELNWILTAITDTIAWQLLDKQLFQKLFRQDLLVASLFKNFLLACRVMRLHGCTCTASPPLPTAHIANHPLWHAWAYEVDRCITAADPTATVHGSLNASRFFAEQRLVFDSAIAMQHVPSTHSEAVDRLPILLQLLLSQSHRSSALWSFARFAQAGDSNIEELLMVGLFPYILKLLQSPSDEIRRPLLWLWLKVLSFDPSCRAELQKEEAMQYFVHCLFEADYGKSSFGMDPSFLDEEEDQCKILASAIISEYIMLSRSKETTDISLISRQSDYLLSLVRKQQGSSLLEAWKLALFGLVVQVHGPKLLAELQQTALKSILKYYVKKFDDPSLVAPRKSRRAAVYCLGSFLKMLDGGDDNGYLDAFTQILHSLVNLIEDSCIDVREEVVISLSIFVSRHFPLFVKAAYWCCANEQSNTRSDGNNNDIGVIDEKNLLARLIWKAILCFAMDPAERIARLAGHVIDEIHMSFIYPASATAAIIGARSRGEPNSNTPTDTAREDGMAGNGTGKRLENGSLPAKPILHNHHSQLLSSRSSDDLLLKLSSVDDSGSCQNNGDIKVLRLRVSDESNTSGSSAPSNAAPAQVELKSIVPLASGLPDDLLSELLLTGKPKADPVRTNRTEIQVQFEVEDALERSKEPRRPLIVIDTGHPIHIAQFISYSHRLATCNLSNSTVSIWQYQETTSVGHGKRGERFQGTKTNTFNNGRCGRIREMIVLEGSTCNLHSTHPLLAVSSSDGAVRIWSDFEHGREHLASAWTASNPDRRGPMLCPMSSAGKLAFTENNDSMISWWDVEHESLTSRKALGSLDECVSCLCYSEELKALFTGTTSNRLLLIDERIKEAQKLAHPTDSIHSFSSSKLLLGSKTSHHLALFDIRRPGTIWERQLEYTHLLLHPQIPIFAASKADSVSFYQIDNRSTNDDSQWDVLCNNTVKYHEGLLGRRVGQVNAIAAHPKRPLFAVAGEDCTLSIFK